MLTTVAAFVIASANAEPIVVRGATLAKALSQVTQATGQAFVVEGDFAQTPVTLVLQGPDYVTDLKNACELIGWRWTAGEKIKIQDEDAQSAERRHNQYILDHMPPLPRVEFKAPVEPMELARQFRAIMFRFGNSNDEDRQHALYQQLQKIERFSFRSIIEGLQVDLATSLLRGRETIRQALLFGDWPIDDCPPLPAIPDDAREKASAYIASLRRAFNEGDVAAAVPAAQSHRARDFFGTWNGQEEVRQELARVSIARWRGGWLVGSGFQPRLITVNRGIPLLRKAVKLPMFAETPLKASWPEIKEDFAAGMPPQSWLTGRLVEAMAVASHRSVLIDYRGLSLGNTIVQSRQASAPIRSRLAAIFFDSHFDSLERGRVLTVRSALPMERHQSALPRSVTSQCFAELIAREDLRVFAILRAAAQLASTSQLVELCHTDAALNEGKPALSVQMIEGPAILAAARLTEFQKSIELIRSKKTDSLSFSSLALSAHAKRLFLNEPQCFLGLQSGDPDSSTRLELFGSEKSVQISLIFQGRVLSYGFITFR